MATLVQDISIGSVLAERYTIQRFLGQGGFATVYEGYDETIEREVAIKILNLPPGDVGSRKFATMIERFKREAKAAARIEHPNIVRIYDMGKLASGVMPFIVMEKLEGHDLREELNRIGALAPERVFAISSKVLSALARAHELKTIHKDLKPSNLFLINPGLPEEEVRVLDFGVAVIKEFGDRLTSTGEMFGTLQYLAPEYILQKEVSPALDVYQMGLIIAELLVGGVLVTGKPVQCLQMHIRGKIPWPEALLSSPIGPFLQKATAVDPKARFHDAGAMFEAFKTLDFNAIPDLRRCVAPAQNPAYDAPTQGWASLPTPPPPVAPRRLAQVQTQDVNSGSVATAMHHFMGESSCDEEEFEDSTLVMDMHDFEGFSWHEDLDSTAQIEAIDRTQLSVTSDIWESAVPTSSPVFTPPPPLTAHPPTLDPIVEMNSGSRRLHRKRTQPLDDSRRQLSPAEAVAQARAKRKEARAQRLLMLQSSNTKILEE